MPLFVVKLFVRAACDGTPVRDHHVAVLVAAADADSARAAASRRELAAGLILPGARGVEVLSVLASTTSQVDELGPVLMAARDAACVMVNDDPAVYLGGEAQV